MPQIFRIGPYIVYFWSNESDPLEPVHVHIAEGRATANGTKVWITGSGKALICNNIRPWRHMASRVMFFFAGAARLTSR